VVDIVHFLTLDQDSIGRGQLNLDSEILTVLTEPVLIIDFLESLFGVSPLLIETCYSFFW